MQPMNLLFVISDEHQRNVTGCYGHPIVQTPNLDQLAARGTRFTHAYTNCPICVPCRASLATGRYVHQIGHGIYMVCDGRYKYIHYLHEPAQLFDLVNDPAEEHNLADNPTYRATVVEYEGRLRAIVDPLAVDAQAKADQQAKLAEFGREETVLQRGLTNSAIPGEAPVFQRMVR